jgi:two-component system, chemotaxis family, sensor kinase CheA
MTELVFEISQDELPIFLSETDEHLQELDDILVKLERVEDNRDLLQTVFRAAHTLKGMAGMIGHKRMVDLTHMMETAFDSVRKNSLPISTPLIDLCLEAVDGLRLLNNEVITRIPSDVDVDELAESFSNLIETGWIHTLESNLTPTESGVKVADAAGGNAASSAAQLHPPKKRISKNGNGDGKLSGGGNGKTSGQAVQTTNISELMVKIRAEIASDSIASAARAFQLMLSLQELGEILEMTPTQEQIETAVPVRIFEAKILTSRTPGEIRKAVEHVSEISRLMIGDEIYQQVRSTQQGKVATKPIYLANPPRLGDFLVKEKYISQTQLTDALRIQKQSGNENVLLGQVLVETGILPEETLNQAIAALVQQQKASPPQAAPAERNTDKVVRTSVERLDNLMNLMGELITDRNRLTQIHSKLSLDQTGNDRVNNLGETVAHLTRITDQLQEEVMRIRMLPIANVFSRFPRLIRDLAQKTGKEVDLVIRGEDTELDRTIIEQINDPLIHLLRNSIDHGVESPEKREAAGKNRRGTITLTARQEQNHIVLTVEDDGEGIDPNRIRQAAVQKGLVSELEAANLSDEKATDLIFISGFSTTQKITDISGRGVGLDIVRNNIQRLNGMVTVDSRIGQGTSFIISLPLTLAIVPTLLVRVNEIHFAIPLVMITEILRLSREELHSVRTNPVILLRNQVLPLLYLHDIFGLPRNKEEQGHLFVVVVRSGKVQVGLVVDELIGQEELVVKSLGQLLGDIPGISSAAILGDGQTALILDVSGLFHFAGL